MKKKINLYKIGGCTVSVSSMNIIEEREEHASRRGTSNDNDKCTIN
jgi:hypothetical protein